MMADNSSIEWTDATWNPIRGCTRVSEGCRNCYAEVMAARFSDPGQWGHGLARRVAQPGGGTDHRWTGEVALVDEALDLPLRWRRPRRIFVNSTSDLFHEKVPDAWIDRVFAVMALAPQHTFQVLTKRPERMREYLTRPVQGPWARRMHRVDDAGRQADATDAWRRVHHALCEMLPNTPPKQLNLASEMQEPHGDGFMPRWPLANVWLGTSVEDQDTANARIPHLLATPAKVRFLSCEPLLGPVDLTRVKSPVYGEVCALTGYLGSGMYGDYGPKLAWVICGGESGPGARPMHPDWARSLRDQCTLDRVPFFFKQWGEWAPDTGPFRDRQDPIMEGKAACAVWTGQRWDHYRDCYGPPAPIPLAAEWMYRLGKNRAGRLLDGRAHDEFPQVTP
jgi:protein gp37